MHFKIAARSLFFLAVITGATYAVAQDQPNMVAARGDLNIAKRELTVAEQNKGGHRAKAIEYVNAAIAEINKGIAYDRRHNHAQTVMSNETFSLANVPDQPHMRAALQSLKDAKGKLENATADKGGHRVKAIEFVDKAIDEVNKGIEVGS
ncbi:MAG: hypothetical protein C5B55_14155 [Blastocatellia bacterium]|nr:MAG: hypothetical protein C5B55_14155 [Blastocatellia bacterium]